MQRHDGARFALGNMYGCAMLEGVEKSHGAIFHAIKSRRDAGTRRAAISSRRDVWRAPRRGASRRVAARMCKPLSQS